MSAFEALLSSEWRADHKYLYRVRQ